MASVVVINLWLHVRGVGDGFRSTAQFLEQTIKLDKRFLFLLLLIRCKFQYHYNNLMHGLSIFINTIIIYK